MAGGIRSNPNVAQVNWTMAAANDPRAVAVVMTQVKNGLDNLAGRTGNALDRAVTLQDLVDLGLVTSSDVTTKLKGSS